MVAIGGGRGLGIAINPSNKIEDNVAKIEGTEEEEDSEGESEGRGEVKGRAAESCRANVTWNALALRSP